jgi:hypothetical protein
MIPGSLYAARACFEVIWAMRSRKLACGRAPRALRVIAETMGAKPVAALFAGLSAQKQKATIPIKMIEHAREAGRKLALS